MGFLTWESRGTAVVLQPPALLEVQAKYIPGLRLVCAQAVPQSCWPIPTPMIPFAIKDCRSVMAGPLEQVPAVGMG